MGRILWAQNPAKAITGQATGQHIPGPGVAVDASYDDGKNPRPAVITAAGKRRAAGRS